jgi:hypothetical protein
MKKIILFALSLVSLSAFAQEKKEEPKFGIKFGGFVKTDFFTDTREVLSSREGHFDLYPLAESLDKDGKDINAHQGTNFLSIQSRLSGAISGPDAFGAKTSGILEADFFGNLGDENGFRLRHAYAKLNWKTTELLMGQYWHPMFVAECFPGVIAFNTGVPFQPFSRNPQIRLSQNLGKSLKIFVSAATQRDFASIGPAAPTTPSSIYMRNSAIPNLHAQIQLKPDSTTHVFGIGADYKTLLPQTSTTGTAGKTVSTAQIQSISAIVYGKLDFKKFVVKVEGVYAQNPYDLTMIGGYAATTAPDAVTGVVKYTNTATGSGWIDMNTKGKKMQVGLFAGYTKNLGSADSISGAYYSRGSSMEYVYRVAPRLLFIAGSLTLALEVEYTAAAYGTVSAIGTARNSKEVANTRGLFSCIYKF